MKTVLDDLEESLKTSKYIVRKNSSNLTGSVQMIITARSEENSKRKDRIVGAVRQAISNAEVFASGNKVSISTRDHKTVLTDGLRYLIDNVYLKLNYVESHFENEDDVKRALQRDTQVQKLDGEAPNRAAHRELTDYLSNQSRSFQKVTIRQLISRFEKRPYGWSEFDTLGVMAELVNVGKLELQKAQETVGPRKPGLVADMRSKTGLDSYCVQVCDEVDPVHLRKAIDLGNNFLKDAPLSDSQRLFEQYHTRLKEKCELLQKWQAEAEREDLPFRDLLGEKLNFLQALGGKARPATFFEGLAGQQQAMEDYVDDFDRLKSFFYSQLTLFKSARNDLQRLKPELRHLGDADLERKVAEVERILSMPDPTSDIPKLKTLLQPVQNSVTETLEQKRQETQVLVGSVRESIEKYVASAYASVADRINLATLLKPVEATELSLGVTKTIDSLIARQSELGQLQIRLQADADAMANQLLLEDLPVGADLPVVKPVVAVRVAALSDKMVLETAADVQDYVDKLRDRLMQEIEQNNRVRVE
jgi:hypothetical protein